jgi:hypothetical protein
MRRNLQREHVKKLSSLVLGEKSGGGFAFFFGEAGGSAPPDARSLARAHLREIAKRISAATGAKQGSWDETTLAHLTECAERIAKVLDASMQVND